MYEDEQQINEKIGERVRKCRMMFGVTLREIANILGVSLQQMQKYEKGKNRISAAKLCIIAQRLNVPVAELLPFNNIYYDQIRLFRELSRDYVAIIGYWNSINKDKKLADNFRRLMSALAEICTDARQLPE